MSRFTIARQRRGEGVIFTHGYDLRCLGTEDARLLEVVVDRIAASMLDDLLTDDKLGSIIEIRDVLKMLDFDTILTTTRVGTKTYTLSVRFELPESVKESVVGNYHEAERAHFDGKSVLVQVTTSCNAYDYFPFQWKLNKEDYPKTQFTCPNWSSCEMASCCEYRETDCYVVYTKEAADE